jgi:hypothetical protein
MSRKLIYQVIGFDKKTEKHVVEYPLKHVDLEYLRSVFPDGVDVDPELIVGTIRLNERSAEQLQSLVDGPIDIKKYDFFFEAVTVSEDE